MDYLLVGATGMTSSVSAIFAIMLYKQYLERRKIHQLVWTAAVALFFLSVEYIKKREERRKAQAWEKR